MSEVNEYTQAIKLLNNIKFNHKIIARRRRCITINIVFTFIHGRVVAVYCKGASD